MLTLDEKDVFLNVLQAWDKEKTQVQTQAFSSLPWFYFFVFL